MTIPKYHELFSLVLEDLKDGQEWRSRDFHQHLVDQLGLSDEERSEKYGGGGNRALGRAYFACLYLYQAGAITRPKKAYWQITELGRNLLVEHPDGLTLDDIRETAGFQDWIRRSKESAAARKDGLSADEADEILEADVAPDELVEAGINRLRDTVATELLTRIRGESPEFLEGIVLDLLKAMGYGEGTDSMKLLGGPGDEGVDGVIMQDKLGLDQIYVQAKRYKEENAVGPAAIHSFIGALHNKGATRGVFITTSRFTSEAQKAAKKLPQPRVILVDGNQLADFMLENEIGVTVQRIYKVYRIDENFFES